MRGAIGYTLRTPHAVLICALICTAGSKQRTGFGYPHTPINELVLSGGGSTETEQMAKHTVNRARLYSHVPAYKSAVYIEINQHLYI